MSYKSYTYILVLNVLKKPSIVAAMLIRNNVLFLSELKPLNFNLKVTHKCFIKFSVVKLHQLFRKNSATYRQASTSDVNR